ncbi:MAG TPA: nuclear transport factor 2 family protein [Pyrinomonadaceae bacterium]|nr:nuclear transport factor 2 family protein [Pyrinomonadaceae bacterium]
MKKILFFVSVLVLSIGCTAPPTNDLSVAANKNTNDADRATPAMTETAAIAQEKAIWDTLKNKDYDAFGGMLASEQIEVISDGIRDKAATIAGVKDFEPTEITFSDWKFLPIDKDVFVVTYTVAVKGKYKGQELKPDSNRASSAWVNRNGKWQGIYHQESPIAKAPSPSPAPSGSPATSGANPASSPSPVITSDDLVANERAIWEALKAKNYDGFASALAPESIEVEPNGVFDKAATVRSVREIDFSKTDVSEFRAVPFDSDAGLVVYKVKLPGPAPAEYHSTIWAKKDGKWMAVFHQGTPISPGAPATTASPQAK